MALFCLKWSSPTSVRAARGTRVRRQASRASRHMTCLPPLSPRRRQPRGIQARNWPLVLSCTCWT